MRYINTARGFLTTRRIVLLYSIVVVVVVMIIVQYNKGPHRLHIHNLRTLE